MGDNTNMKIYIGALIVVLLQVLLGPIISINAVVPNFLLAYAIVCIVLRPDKLHITFAFLMGFIYDLVFSGPVGAMSFVMVVFSFIVSQILLKMKVMNLGLSLLVLFLSLFFVELFYGMFQASITVSASFIEVLAYRVLPCSIFDIILAFIMFAIMGRIIAPPVDINQGKVNTRRDSSR